MVTTTEQRIMVLGKVERDVTVTKHVGRATYDTPCGRIEADICTEYDYGPKYGTTRLYEKFPEGVTPEQSEQTWAAVSRLAGRIVAGG